ncbi:SDR family NAD(P)-dependent oxidoreductase [Pseudarthrobacter equi]|uniref:SDR family NAD(P)-dependent oxidoreductase n=1 Tax=Pseudarthrobacter equi TaxID=728066 RepID=UPI0021BF719D|nr:SDR family NAD(P)-dependent oxidoreductase [Pseudarthrobacter equi]MCT9626997.1 SDR family NAD(P)-dependent oxidoreductase [Pseudarthrobacter equi]
MGRLAVVTGANRGLGYAIVRELSENGWDVLALTRTSAEPAGGSWPAGVVPVLHDVRSQPTLPLKAAVGQRPVDLLINNAAQGAPHAKLGAIGADGLLNAVDVNVAGPLRLTQSLLPNLLAAPDPVIVNVSSRLGSVAAQAKGDFADLSTSYAYKVSKAAQNMLTVSLAQELQGQVRCWAVHPGKLATAMGQSDASKSPATAARQLRELVDSGSRTSPRFCSLGEEDLAW